MNEAISVQNAVQDFSAFECTPGLIAVVLPDHPVYTSVAISNELLHLSGMRREEVVGKGHFETFPENPLDPGINGEENLKASFSYIIDKKIPHEIAVQRYDVSNGDGTFKTKYWKIRNAPILNESGNVAYIINTALDITDQINAQQKIEAGRSIEKAYKLLMTAPVIIAIVTGDNFVIELANEGMLEIWGKNQEVIGKPLQQAIPEWEEHGFIEVMKEVSKTARPFHTFENPITYVRNEKEEVSYFDFIYRPYYEDESIPMPTGVIIVAHDVTEQVLNRKQLEEITGRLNFRNAIFEAQNEATPDGVLIVNARGKMLLMNKRFADIWEMPQFILDNKDDDAALKYAMTKVADPVGFQERVIDLYKNGKEKSYDLIEFKDRRLIERFGIPIIAENGLYYGWAWYFRDITEQRKSVEALRQSEAQFRTLANSINQLAWMADGSGFIYWYNERWYEYTGTTLEQMKGWGWEKVHHPDYIDDIIKFVKVAWTKPEPFELTFPLRGQDGKYRWFLTRVYPIQDNEGKIVLWIGTNTDIDEQKQTEAQLEEKILERSRELESQTNLVQNILENSSNGISVTEMIRDHSGDIIDASTILANDAAVRFTGLPKEVYLSTTAKALDPDIFNSTYGRTCLETLRSGSPSIVQYYLEVTSRWLELTISKMDDNHLIHIFTDITAIKEAQLQLEKTLKEVTHSNANLQEFAYAASHDLKEPIRKITYYISKLKNLLDERLVEEEIKVFDRVELAGKRMTSLIDDLLTYSQVTMGANIFEEVDLNELLQLVLSDLDLEIEEKNAKITTAKLFNMRGNPRQLQQVFQNLISNALKYGQPGVVPEIVISCQLLPNHKHDEYTSLQPKPYYLVTIKDNGIGFNQEDAEKIFHAFTRLPGNKMVKGSGVGLAIVRRVIENHAGYIAAESQPGKGAQFNIYIPVDHIPAAN